MFVVTASYAVIPVEVDVTVIDYLIPVKGIVLTFQICICS